MSALDTDKLARLAELAPGLERLVEALPRILELLEHAAPATDERGGIRALATWLGTTPAGAKAAAHRDPSLAALASRRGTVRVWLRRDVERWLDDRRARPAPRLRVVAAKSVAR